MNPRCKGPRENDQMCRKESKDYRAQRKMSGIDARKIKVAMLIRTEKELCDEKRPERKRTQTGNEGR